MVERRYKEAMSRIRDYGVEIAAGQPLLW